MSKIQELQDRLNKLQEEIDSLKLKEGSGAKWPRMSLGSGYYYIFSDGRVGRTSEDAVGVDDSAYEIGNYFTTKEDAEYYAKRWVARQRFERLAEVCNEGKYEFTPRANNYYIYFDGDALGIGYMRHCRSDGVYFKSSAAAERCISLLTEEDKKILFAVNNTVIKNRGE